MLETLLKNIIPYKYRTAMYVPFVRGRAKRRGLVKLKTKHLIISNTFVFHLRYVWDTAKLQNSQIVKQ